MFAMTRIDSPVIKSWFVFKDMIFELILLTPTALSTTYLFSPVRVVIPVAVMGKKALGAIELVPKRKFYDYKAKYSSSAKTKHIMPASISKKNYKRILNIALKAHKVLGCKGVTRSDFRFYKNKFYLLETNTQPGMTNLSLVPEIARYCGINFEDLVLWMVNNASTKR